MVDVTDTNNTRGKLANEWESLEEADIDDRDRAAITAFVEHRREFGDVAMNTQISDLGNLRRASLRAETPLVDMDIRDARWFISRLTDPKSEGGYGLTPEGGGVFGYKRALRVFFNWLDEEPGYGEYDFGERLELPSQNYEDETIAREDLLTEDEIEAMKAAAKNPRDPALIDFLADVGARISLALSLRVGDVSGIDTKTPTFRPNSEAVNLKGVESKDYPILFSRAELREWINRHHPDPHPDAPLWPVVNGYDPDEREQCAASGDTIRDSLRRHADRAGIDVDVHPHHFRHVFMTRVANSELTDRDIQHMSMLTDQQLRMLDVYDHSTADEHNESIMAAHGFIDPDAVGEDGEPEVTMAPCPNCREQVKSTAYFCPRCSVPLADQLREAVSEAEDRTLEYLVEADSQPKRQAASEIAQSANHNPEFAEALVDELQRLGED
ncbi:tyrosine-type recombinase/integrase [Haloarchaeobius sp. HRN-SO-5]|uniref:tyrosine-type recombinase/integrase n=1 Tax=Haloarchaeobius sp. HRN-SO-5 TaxID=3446118 RepID=UPI003EBDE650